MERTGVVIVAGVCVALGAALLFGLAARWNFSGWRRRRRWNRQYRRGEWDHLDVSADREVLEPMVSRYARHGNVLDVGCGRANNQTLDESTYASYLGIDISDVAIAQARATSKIARARFVVADMRTFEPEPDLRFNVILFRESIYYLSPAEMPGFLRRYSKWLTSDGVIVVRIWTESVRRRFDAAVSGLASFTCVEQCSTPEGGWVGVLRPKDT